MSSGDSLSANGFAGLVCPHSIGFFVTRGRVKVEQGAKLWIKLKRRGLKVKNSLGKNLISP